MKNKDDNREIQILFHTILYWYDDNQEMPEREEEHVKQMINEGYKAGELNDNDNSGWWEIVF